MASHGIGGPGTAMLTEELIDSGIRCIVRVGTCGPLEEHLRPGMPVITSGIVRDDGTSQQYLPLNVPAVPDTDLLIELQRSIQERHLPFRVGMTHCKDAYYSEDPNRMLAPASWVERWAALRRLGVLVTENEAGTLFAIAALRRVQAAAVFVVGGADNDRIRASLISCAVAASVAGRRALRPVGEGV
jgi:uridine phosphorylase